MASGTIYVTYDGDTYWLSCFAADPDSEMGDVIHPIDAGDDWDDLAAKIAAHRETHGCDRQVGANGA